MPVGFNLVAVPPIVLREAVNAVVPVVVAVTADASNAAVKRW